MKGICLCFVLLCFTNWSYASDFSSYDSITKNMARLIENVLLHDLKSVMTSGELVCMNEIDIEFTNDFYGTPYSVKTDTESKIIFPRGFLFLLNHINDSGMNSISSDDSQLYFEHVYNTLKENMREADIDSVLLSLPSYNEWIDESGKSDFLGMKMTDSNWKRFILNSNMNALAFILSHEFAHHFLNHFSEDVKGIDKESQADYFGLDLTLRAGYNPALSLNLFRLYLRLKELNSEDEFAVVQSEALCRLDKMTVFVMSNVMNDLSLKGTNLPPYLKRVLSDEGIEIEGVIKECIYRIRLSNCDTIAFFDKLHEYEKNSSFLRIIKEKFDSMLVQKNLKGVLELCDGVASQRYSGLVRPLQISLLKYFFDELMELPEALPPLIKVFDPVLENDPYWNRFARSDFLLRRCYVRLIKGAYLDEKFFDDSHEFRLAEKDVEAAVELETDDNEIHIVYAAFLGRKKKLKESREQLILAKKKVVFDHSKISRLEALLNVIETDPNKYVTFCERLILSLSTND
jgi:hypothetical protein